MSFLIAHKSEPFNQVLFLLKSSENYMELDESKGNEIQYICLNLINSTSKWGQIYPYFYN